MTIHNVADSVKLRDENGNVVNNSNPLPMYMGFSPQLSREGRVLTSQPYGQFQHKNTGANRFIGWHEITANGGSIAMNTNAPIRELSVGTASGDRALTQTIRYFPYIPGNPHRIKLTGFFATAKTNQNQYIMYGDDSNGCGFIYNANGIGVFVRSSASGSVVDTIISQANWNRDKLDGTGTSGTTLVPTNSQLYIMDYLWQGVDGITFALKIGDEVIPIHTHNFANTATGVYFAQPSLPIRHEIINTGIASGASTLSEICSAIETEGGDFTSVSDFSISNWQGTTAGLRTGITTTAVPILAVRLKDSLLGKANKNTLRLNGISVFGTGTDFLFELHHVHFPNTPTAIWQTHSANQGWEYSTDISAYTASLDHIIDTIQISSTNNRGSATPKQTLAEISGHSFLSQNFDSTNSEMFVIVARAMTGTGDVSASINISEFN